MSDVGQQAAYEVGAVVRKKKRDRTKMMMFKDLYMLVN